VFQLAFCHPNEDVRAACIRKLVPAVLPDKGYLKRATFLAVEQIVDDLNHGSSIPYYHETMTGIMKALMQKVPWEVWETLKEVWIGPMMLESILDPTKPFGLRRLLDFPDNLITACISVGCTRETACAMAKAVDEKFRASLNVLLVAICTHLGPHIAKIAQDIAIFAHPLIDNDLVGTFMSLITPDSRILLDKIKIAGSTYQLTPGILAKRLEFLHPFVANQDAVDQQAHAVAVMGSLIGHSVYYDILDVTSGSPANKYCKNDLVNEAYTKLLSTLDNAKNDDVRNNTIVSLSIIRASLDDKEKEDSSASGTINARYNGMVEACEKLNAKIPYDSILKLKLELLLDEHYLRQESC
jgi:hypothetical protein